ncbi:MAG: zf-HC2 domain-containing protein [Janthinobacterium lividum]
MTCDTLQAQLTAWLDGELMPEMAAEMEQHLAACFDCALARVDLAAVREMAAAWTVDVPDISRWVMQAVEFDDQPLHISRQVMPPVESDNQRLLLEEIRHLRTEMQDLREELAALRRQLLRRIETPQWTPPARPEYSKMENDPWILTRS